MPLDPIFSKISISHLLWKSFVWNFACGYLEPKQVFYVLIIFKKHLTLSHKSAFKKISKLPPPELRLLFHWNTSLFKTKDFFFQNCLTDKNLRYFSTNVKIFCKKKSFYTKLSPLKIDKLTAKWKQIKECCLLSKIIARFLV